MSPRNLLLSSSAVLLVLLPWFGGLVVGEVSNDFSHCLDFFYNQTPPRGIMKAEHQAICEHYNNYRYARLYRCRHLSPADGNWPKSRRIYEPRALPRGVMKAKYRQICQRYYNSYRLACLHHRHDRSHLFSSDVLSPGDGKWPKSRISAAEYQPICQRYKNNYRFASLYHRQHRRPLFSAYVLSPADGKRPESRWMYEPQLAFSGASPEMTVFRTIVDQNVIQSQAVIRDYTNSTYSKGHLNPSSHQRTKEDREATFTLTNIVPQRNESNCGPWSVLENEVLRRFKDFCKGPMYVITGVIPYESDTHWINDRVSVPEYMWSAYCCPLYKSDIPEAMSPFFPTYGAVGRNDPSSGEEIVPINAKAKPKVRGYDVRQMPLKTLEVILVQRLRAPLSLFDGDCKK